MVADDYAATRDVAVEDSDPADVAAIESTFAADFAGGTAPATSSGDHLLWSPGSEPRHPGCDQRGPAFAGGGERGDGLDRRNRRSGVGGPTRRGRGGVHDGGQLVHGRSRPDRRRRWATSICIPIEDGVLYIHEKLVLADAGTAAATALVGSINFSTSSMEYNRELDIVLNETRRSRPAGRPRRRLRQRLRRRAGDVGAASSSAGSSSSSAATAATAATA